MIDASVQFMTGARVARGVECPGGWQRRSGGCRGYWWV